LQVAGSRSLAHPSRTSGECGRRYGSRAKAVPGSHDVQVNGGADIARQFLNAGLIAEVRLHLVPVALGAGTPLFTGVSADLRLVPSDATSDASVTHLTYEVTRPATKA